MPNALGYTPENMTLEKGTTMTTNTPSVSGGAVTSWEISPSLPTGLSFGSTNGSIWGTPSVLQTSATTYTIWANNSGGSESAQVNITINDQVASIAYPSTVEVSNDRAMTTVTPTNTGGAVTSWEIDPSLPSSLSFGSTNGSIWGTPTGLLANATYTVYANNSGGSSSATFTLGLNWTLTPSAEGAYITRNSSIGSDITFQYYNASRASFVYANTKMSAGRYHTCAILDNGDLKCWGKDTDGQVGDSSSTYNSWSPSTTVTLYGDAVAVSGGRSHTCALLDGGDVKCWGDDQYGQLGDGATLADRTTPPYSAINLGTGRTAVAISAGGYHTCALLDNGDVKCWGRDNEGQLGDGGTITSTDYTAAPSSTAINLGTGRTAVAISAGEYHTCAILDNGDLKCWGMDNAGQLGDGGANTSTSAPSSTAVNLGAGRTAVAVAAGWEHTCAILDNGDMKCWGKDAYGQLGDGGSNTHTNAPSSTAINLGTGRTAVALTASFRHTCALLDNGDVKCWGRDNFGQLGDGGTITSSDYTTAPSSTAINLGPGRTAVSLSSGTYHTCAVLDNADMKCWGYDHYGQLGDGWPSGTDSSSPVLVSGSHTWDSSTGVNTGMVSVSGATCAISPSLPTGMSLTSGTCAITGTPTVTAVNATYTVWANISGTSYSGQVWLEVGLNAPIPSYAPASYTSTKGITVSTVLASNTGGEVTTWGINATLPSGLSFGTSNGSIWGTPDTLTPATTYTVYANNSAGSSSTTITFTVNDHAPAPINAFSDNITLDYGQAITPIGGFEVRPDLIAAGLDHTCAIKSDGSVRCWGDGTYGKLGHGGSGDRNTPTATASLGVGRTAIDITAGGEFTCAVLDDGSVVCWGRNDYGQLGDGTLTNRNTPTQTISLGRPAVAIEAGSHHSACALLDNGSVSCWGRNHKGQLGRGYTNSTADLSQRTPALTLPMPGGQPVVALDIGHYMVCAVLGNGSIACWGQYGGGNTPSLKTFFNASNPAIDVSTGRYAGCGLLGNGSVTCWGTGWLGTGGESQSADPGDIWPNLGSGRTAVELEIGRKHRCVLLDDDSVKCWGDDYYGQLGNGGGQGNKNAPFSTTFASNLGLQRMSAGHWHTCIASKTNEVYCWGDGAEGKLGDGSTSINQNPGKTNHFSGTNPVKAHGDITSWAIHPSLPTGLSFGSSNGTIWGTPTASIPQTNFTIYANNSGGSSSLVLNLGVEPDSPGPFEYIPENNTLTNNSLVHIAPSFVNITTGNGTTWQVGSSDTGPGSNFAFNINGVVYFDAGSNEKLWAYNPTTNT
ncbi:MAG: putative Ig domain-containing protein, partial [Candidatus Poseidoniaceae archaeon]